MPGRIAAVLHEGPWEYEQPPVPAGSGILDSLEEAGDTPPELDETPGGLTAAVRHKLASLASCWAQLVHKSQTVFQNNAKLEVGGDSHLGGERVVPGSTQNRLTARVSFGVGWRPSSAVIL